jgi:tetratricopeptide (TPR) repeat protein
MAAEPSHAPVSRIETELRRARELMEKRQFAAALSLAQTLRAEVPENRDLLYLIAAAERYLGRIAEALRTLERLEELHPLYARLFQERGHCYRAIGDAARAIAAYQRAVALNEALPASWRALEELLRAAGRKSEAEHARTLAEYLAGLPAGIVSASSLFAEGELTRAEQLVREYLQTDPQHIEGMRLLARIGVKFDVLDDAEFLLESVLAFAPDYHAARYEYAEVLCQRHKYAQAVAEARKLRAIEPRSRNYRILYANALIGLGDHEGGMQVYRELLEETPQNPELHLSVAHALKTLGRQAEAIESYRAAAAAQPSFGDAYWSLANLKTYRFGDEELARMRAEEGREGHQPVDRYHLCFALGKALEDRGEYAESFRYYERGNALKKTETRYGPAPLERTIRAQMTVCTREFFAARAGVGCRRPDPIFIVGLPRAGSTLIEQILASHSCIEGTMELADIPRLVQHLSGREQIDTEPRYPAVLPELTPERLERFGEKYLADTRVYRTGARPFFIDKLPNNFRHVGLIHLILPNAKIIDARREPMACCFSNFKQLFASGQEFTYSLEDIGRYYRAYVQLMAHWDDVLPGKVLRVQHEELVENLEAQVRRILDFVSLDFEPGCLEFHRTERSVRTASSEQVRQPIYREGISQWRHFEPWLGPLRAALSEPDAA